MRYLRNFFSYQLFCYGIFALNFLLFNSSHAAEPLNGPAIGQTWWTVENPKSSSSSPSTSSTNTPTALTGACSEFSESRREELKKQSLHKVNEHFSTTSNAESGNPERALTKQRQLALDIPVPVNLAIAMPFVLLRHIDRSTSWNSQYSDSQELALGLLHHPAEGEPAWRIESSRWGAFRNSPLLKIRAIGSLSKPFPWLKLRPSDSLYSWMGFSYFSGKNYKSQLIPEIAWKRAGQDGLLIDCHAPKHFFIGFRSQRFGVLFGAEQDIKPVDLQPIDPTVEFKSEQNELNKFRIERYMRLQGILNPYENGTLNFSVIKTLYPKTNYTPMGLELAAQWVPTL